MDADGAPLISVVIPVKDSAETIGEQLEALGRQTFGGRWEVIISDNGSHDDLLSQVEAWKARLPDLQVVDSSATPGAGAARNAGARAARAELLAFCDADDRVTPEWLAAMVAALQSHPLVAGAMDHESLNPGETTGWHFRSHVDSAPLGSRFKPYALSANMGVRRRVFDEVGGFPEDLEITGGAAGEDMALSWALQLAGHELHFEPSAVVSYRHRHTSGELWKQHVAYGYAETVLYRNFRGHGVPRSRLLGALRIYLRLLFRSNRLLDARNRAGWLREAARRYGRLRGSIRERVLYL